jgi:hypothetical protein
MATKRKETRKRRTITREGIKRPKDTRETREDIEKRRGAEAQKPITGNGAANAREHPRGWAGLPVEGARAKQDTK